MNIFNKMILTMITVTSVFFTNTALARGVIPVGEADKVEIVADLPNTEDYKVEGTTDRYLDLGRYHQEYNVAWIFPVWITEEPRLVLAEKDSETYYTLTKEQLDFIIKENNLNKEELVKLSLYTRFGGQAVVGLLILLMLYSFISKNKKKEEEE